jgi:alpha-glucosidase (family GH31 glycosyl hydrolase)
MPYIYSNAFTSFQTGLPLMRALVLEHQKDGNVYDIGDQYYFGNNLMVCPVTTKGAQTRSIYLPEGKWIDYWTGKKYDGKQFVHVVTPVDTIPVFAKAGAIIPMQPAMKYTDEKPVSELTLDIFPGANSSFNLYEDDGLTLDYKQGKFSLTQITTNGSSGAFKVNISKATGVYQPASRTYLAKVRWVEDKLPTKVTENGKVVKAAANAEALLKAGWFYDLKEKALYVKTSGTQKSNIELIINY